MNTTGKIVLGVGVVGAGIALVVGLRRAAPKGATATPSAPTPGVQPGVPSAAAAAQNAAVIATGLANSILAQAGIAAPGTPTATTAPGAVNAPVLDILNPAPPDVNNPAPPGSAIVGQKEASRIANLQERWARLEQAGLGPGKAGMTDDILIKYVSWKGFPATRFQHTMEGWENQFRSLNAVEDAWRKTHPSFIIDRRDVTA